MEKKNLTMDAVISRAIPILGMILFITGFWYLIYTSVWESLNIVFRLGIGFFASFLIIGAGLTMKEKVGDFKNIIIGGGILLFYGTLIYGSRTADLAVATIPKIASISTSAIATILMAYLASREKSLTVLILGIIGAYATPFIIGQNDVWASNISFNSYLIYFAFISATIAILGRELDIEKILPLNFAGLFVSTIAIYSLVYYGESTAISNNFFTSKEFSVILMAIITSLSVVAFVFSMKNFKKITDNFLLGILILSPMIWFLFQHLILAEWYPIEKIVKIIAYIIMAVAYFWWWNHVRNAKIGDYRHTALYAGGIISLVFAASNIFDYSLNVFSSIFIAFTGLIIVLLNFFTQEKWERTLSAIILTAFGGIMGVILAYSDNYFQNLSQIIFNTLALIPAILLFFVGKFQKNTPESVQKYLKVHSGIAFLFAIILLIIESVSVLDFNLVMFILPAFALILYYYIQQKSNANGVITFAIILLFFGFFPTLMYLIEMMIPHAADNYGLISGENIFSNSLSTITILTIASLGLAMQIINRDTEKQENNFILTTIYYSVILLFVNFLIIVIANDLGVAKEVGGIRAILTTFWWITLALFMIFLGIKKPHRNYEKILGLCLLFLTIFKIAFYDLSTMDMDRKIIVLMIAGGGMLMFSYFLQKQGYLTTEKSHNNQEK